MINTDINGDIGIISLDKPPVNAINHDFVTHLIEALKEFQNNDSIQGVILQGKSGCFSAGLDIVELFPKDRLYIKNFWKDFSSLLLDMFSYQKPLYSSIGGHCPAGGTAMVIMTDYRIMSSGKYLIGLNEIDVGLTVPHSIGTVFQYVVGERNAEDMLLKARLVSPDEALQVGLIDEVYSGDDILNATLERIVTSSSLYSPQQIQTKKILRETAIKIIQNNFNEDTSLILDSWFSDIGQERLEKLYKRLSNNNN